jgi:type III pantothenate kinase
MLLAIDVGNTNTVFALYRERTLIGQWRLSTNRERTAEEYAAALIQLMALKGVNHEHVSAVLISSVVPQAVIPLRWMVRDFFPCRAFVVGEDVDCPIAVKINNPREVGADRVVNAVAACKRYTPPLIIVDFGTATTFDVVDDDGAYAGGAIAPGINLSIEALHQAAAKLPRIALEAPENVIGRSTVGAMQSGIFWGYVGLIEGLVARIQDEYGKKMTVLATGGLAPLFVKRCPALQHLDRDLTMAGLLEIYELNRDLMRSGAAGAAA